MEQQDAVRRQYGRRADAYARSPEHAGGSDLERLLELLDPQPGDTALDVATGTGFTALALAPRVLSVVALDLTPEMLLQGQRLADEAGLDNIAFVPGDVHSLPFADQKFDLVTARRAPHHFHDVRCALREMHRVLKSSGRLGVVDQITPAEGDAGQLMETLERLRDPSHVHALTLREWREALVEAGFQVKTLELQGARRLVDEWLSLAGTPPPVAADITRRFAQAPEPARRRLGYEDGPPASFLKERLVGLAVPAAAP
jgi:SAM-dependent methyltransferase